MQLTACMLRGIDWVIMAGGTAVSDVCEDDTRCDDGCRTHIMLFVINLVATCVVRLMHG